MELDTIMAIIGVAGFALSEIIGLNPKWKANSVLQLVANILKSVKPIKKV